MFILLDIEVKRCVIDYEWKMSKYNGVAIGEAYYYAHILYDK